MSGNMAENARWTALLPNRARLPQMLLISFMFGLAYIIYHRFGSVEGAFAGHNSTLTWMVYRWKTGRNSYGPVYHLMGWLTPVVSLALVWLRRKELAHARKSVFWPGLLIVIGALAAHYVGVKAEQARLSLLSIIALVWGIPLFIFGAQVARILLFPSLFLIFCVPLNFLDAPMFKVRLLITRFTAALLNGLGLECMARSTTLQSTTEGGFSVRLPPPDIGLGAFLIFLFAITLWAYLSRFHWLRRALFFFSALPLYAVGMVVTMAGLAVVAQAMGTAWKGPGGGMLMTIVMLVATLLALGLHRLLGTAWKPAFRRWKRNWTQQQETGVPSA